MLTKLLNLFERLRKYQTHWVEDLPENPERDTVYVIGGREHPYYAAIICPRKNCKNIVHLEISTEFKKRWKLHEHHDGSVSLSPSVHVINAPCGCHYFLRKGKITWAEFPVLFVPKENRNCSQKQAS